jgi:hypothetical protein
MTPQGWESQIMVWEERKLRQQISPTPLRNKFFIPIYSNMNKWQKKCLTQKLKMVELSFKNWHYMEDILYPLHTSTLTNTHKQKILIPAPI